MNSLNTPRRQRGMSTIQSVIAVAAGTIGMILAIVLIVQYSVTSYGARDVSGEAAMTPEAITARIKPIEQISMFDPTAAAPAAAVAATTAGAAAPAPGAAPAAMPVALASAAAPADKGKATFEGICTGCHTAGLLGSPKFGDKVAWAPRIAKGMDALYVSALKGKNAMPAKGGNPTLADDDVKAAVQYMVSAAK